MKDYIGKTKDVLEARVEEVSQFEDKITILSDELNKNKQVAEEFRKKMIMEISKTNAEAAKIKSSLTQHMEDYKSTFINNEFYMDKSSNELRAIEKRHEQLRAYMDGKLE